MTIKRTIYVRTTSDFRAAKTEKQLKAIGNMYQDEMIALKESSDPFEQSIYIHIKNAFVYCRDRLRATATR